jgi:hypothetical protein
VKLRNTLAAAIVLLMVAFMAASCGGDPAKAKAYVREGDALLVKIQPVSQDLSSAISELFKAVFAEGKVDAAAFVTGAAKIKEQADRLLSGAESARKEYARVAELEGVTDYARYADYQQQIIELNAKGVADLNAFLDEWAASAEADAFDPVAFVNASRAFAAKADETAAAIGKLENEAAGFKKEMEL